MLIVCKLCSYTCLFEVLMISGLVKYFYFFYYCQKDTSSAEKFIKIQIPATLKKQLVDDWEFVNQQDKVFTKS